MYYAILKSTVDADHRSDRFENTDLKTAKNEARANYQNKYPNDNLDNTTFETGTVR